MDFGLPAGTRKSPKNRPWPQSPVYFLRLQSFFWRFVRSGVFRKHLFVPGAVFLWILGSRPGLETLAVPEKFYVIGYALSLIFMPDAVFNV